MGEGSQGTIELDLGIDLCGRQQRRWRSDDPGHRVYQVRLLMVAAFHRLVQCAPIVKHVRLQVIADGHTLSFAKRGNQVRQLPL